MPERVFCRNPRPWPIAPGTPVNGDTPTGQPTLTDDPVGAATRYYYRATAVREGGESETSAEVPACIPPSLPPRPWSDPEVPRWPALDGLEKTLWIV